MLLCQNGLITAGIQALLFVSHAATVLHLLQLARFRLLLHGEMLQPVRKLLLPQGMTPLMFASRNGQIDLVKLLLRRQAKVDLSDCWV